MVRTTMERSRNLAALVALGLTLGVTVTVAQAGGFLWFSAEDSSPVMIHRYNISTGLIDLSVAPVDPSNGQPLCDVQGVCNNLAIDGIFMYIGTDGSDLFAKADAITGIVTSVQLYDPPIRAGDIFEDGAYHAGSDRLWRTMTNNHLLETTTTGTVIQERVVQRAGFHLLGLVWIGDVLYATVLHDKQFGIISDPSGSPIFTQIPLNGIPVDHKYDGLAYDDHDGVLYMTTRIGSSAILWVVDPDAGEATQVVDLTGCGYPAGAKADAIGWIPLGAPSVCPIGPRYLEVTPAAGESAVALLVTSDDEPCVSLYVQAPQTINGNVIGRLGANPVLLTPAEWGTVNVNDEAILPGTSYTVQSELAGSTLSEPTTATTWAWADANNSGGSIDFDDILCILDAFAGSFPGACSFFGADIEGGVTNVTIDFDDVLAALNAFAGDGYFDNPTHVDPCP